MQGSCSLLNKKGIPDTHFFVYKDKQYPIKFDFFKYSSKFFSDNQNSIQKIKEIQLVDKEYEKYSNFSDYSINSFIKYVQCENIILDNNNITALNYLSKKYKVPELFEATNKYLSNHYQDLILPIILLHQNDPSYDISLYEDILASKLAESLQDPQLLQLKTSILYRLLTKYQLNNKKGDKNPANKNIIDFLFKYLDVHGIEASVLFSCVDFGELRNEYVNRLLKDYQKTFDFHFINSSLVKTLYETNNELIEKTENCHIEQEKSFDFLKKEIEKVRSEQKQKESEMLSEIKKLKDENEKMKLEQKQKEDEMLTEIKELKKEIEKFKLEQKDEMKKKTKLEIEKSKVQQVQAITISYNSSNSFKGIIDYITKVLNENVTVTSSSSEINNVPQHAIQYENSNYFASLNKQGSWIQFYFNNHQVILKKYVIKAPPFGENSDNPRSWIIEGSNSSNSDWEPLDVQNDCPYLNGSQLTHEFNINSNKSFKYIKMRETGTNWFSRYYLCMSSIEFYGTLI